ncbi:hypothetical protein TRIUR3_34437 [Triticum urartu]|uniref:Uncharacterized protein n=1 Tax=Triticum urartu TaxID=4572 RepID=M7YSQ8_TRIUA|nr:hypothetical protein TRIUR3_34437 [Triticum urartu]
MRVTLMLLLTLTFLVLPSDAETTCSSRDWPPGGTACDRSECEDKCLCSWTSICTDNGCHCSICDDHSHPFGH